MKQADQLQPWTLSFRARAKRFDFDFKFKYSKILPICKLLRLSIRFNLRPFALEFESKPESAFSLKRKLSELKFLQKFKSFRRRRCRNKGIVKSWLDRKNNLFGRRENRVCLWILVFAVAVCFVIVQLSSHFRSRFLWNCFWMGWNYLLPSGFLHHFFKGPHLMRDCPTRKLANAFRKIKWEGSKQKGMEPVEGSPEESEEEDSESENLGALSHWCNALTKVEPNPAKVPSKNAKTAPPLARKPKNGLMYVDVKLNGKPVRAMVDIGATH